MALVGGSFVLSTCYAFLWIMFGIIHHKDGPKEAETNIIGYNRFFNILGGFVGSVFLAVSISTNRKFKRWVVIFTFVSIVLKVLYMLEIYFFWSNRYVLILNSVLNGFFSISVASVCFEWVADLSPDTSLSFSSSIINTFGLLLACLQCWVFTGCEQDKDIDRDSTILIIGAVQVGFQLLAFMLFCLIKVDQDYEEESFITVSNE